MQRWFDDFLSEYCVLGENEHVWVMELEAAFAAYVHHVALAGAQGGNKHYIVRVSRHLDSLCKARDLRKTPGWVLEKIVSTQYVQGVRVLRMPRRTG